jgi:PhzF family phenazine biosynthesis protein
MTLTIYQVDAFTSEPFKGNPAAVLVLPEPPEDAWMQSVAVEMNLSETAFLIKTDEGYNLRWFTPGAEVALCGHATLASAHILWETGQLAPGETARFHTLSGLLTARQMDGWIELDFPAKLENPAGEMPELIDALGVQPSYVGVNPFDYLVVVDDEAVVRSLNPDFGKLAQLPVRGVIVTSRAASDSDFDFISRFFAPAVGVPEDPVTGSAHCCLAPYWAGKLGKNEMLAYQASQRGGVLQVAVKENGRVLLRGQAVTVLKGELSA